ncbi:MAG: hypothetical protein RR835_10810 [Peptostreptococcaceae bacterium]
MKRSKKIMVIGVILMSLTFSVGCSSRNGDVNSVDGEIIDKLPEDQKDTELDKALASIRKARKESIKSKDGGTVVISDNGSRLPGQSENIPDFSNESYEMSEQRAKAILDYIENELKVSKREYVYDTSQCLDPRMNAIYDEEDKGVAKGYENENIWIEEYETESDNVYSYLIVVRDSKDSPWKIIHHGNSYKE